MPETTPVPGPLTWAIRAVAALGLVLATGLAYQAYTTDPLPGCGGDSGCGSVLTSAWSYWLTPYLPVSAVAMVVWAAVNAGAWATKLERLLVPAALLAAGAAVWFVVVQAAMLQQWCFYCLGVHGCAVAAAVLVAVRRRGFHPPGVAAAALGLVALVVGQVALPVTPPHLADDVPVETQTVVLPADHGAPTGAAPAGPLDPYAGLPVLGNPDAPHRLVVFFDYTCHHCHQLHALLDEARRRYGAQLSIVCAPAPISNFCNEHARRTPTAHLNACRYARFALAVWVADPAKFAAMDAFLFDWRRGQPRAPAEVRPHAVQLVGEDALITALQSEEIDRLLKLGSSRSFELGNAQDPPVGILLPKLLIGEDQLLTRVPGSARALFDELEKQLGVTPTGSLILP